MQGFLNDCLKDVAEGKWGAAPKSVYWWLHAHALHIGIAFTAAYGVLWALGKGGYCTSCAGYSSAIAEVAGFLAASGLVVGFHAADAPSDVAKDTK